MIVYCAGAIKGDTSYQKYLKEIIIHLSSLDHTPLSELNENFKSAIPLTDKEIFKRDIKWLEQSKIMIAEISGTSLGVGFEISYALYELKIPVLALYNSKVEAISAMISGCTSKLITTKSYKDIDELKNIVSDFIKKHTEN
ncbi:MAG: nucleoside 2-deoxyribosyltransferase [Bacteroidetes bacterium]|nr:nucleoside 2-deoxyribosyltransferase [Bacteroidota bacterium]